MINHICDFVQLLTSEPEEMMVLGARFKLDFGPWKKGDYVDILYFNYEEGKLTEYTMSEEVIRYSYIGLTAIDTPCPENKPKPGELPFDRLIKKLMLVRKEREKEGNRSSPPT